MVAVELLLVGGGVVEQVGVVLVLQAKMKAKMRARMTASLGLSLSYLHPTPF